MSGFGDKLRREREMRGILLEEISESTKIGTRSLRALEEDDFDLLPGGIFNKGFVRAYCRFLGLNEEQTVAEFEDAFRQYKLAQAPPPVIEPEEPERKGAGFSWALVILFVLILAAVVWVVGHRHGMATAAGDRILQPESTASAATTVSTPARVSESRSNQDRPQIASAADHRPATAHERSASKLVGVSANVESAANSTATMAKPAATASQIATPAHPAAIRLQVFAREDSWMSVLADGKNLGEGILSAQKTRNIHAEKEVKLKLGNVGGVEISFNGKPVDIDGQPQQVKELTFTAQGLQQ